MMKASKLSAEDFARVKEYGRAVRVGPLVVSTISGDKKRLGIVITRRAGGAVRRNRIRRVVREFFRINGRLFPNGDSVIVAGLGASGLSNDEIRGHLERALSRLDARLKKDE